MSQFCKKILQNLSTKQAETSINDNTNKELFSKLCLFEFSIVQIVDFELKNFYPIIN